MSSREQKLVDLVFEIALTINSPKYRETFDKMDNEELAAWISEQLKGCGFETKPVGMSWGVLQ